MLRATQITMVFAILRIVKRALALLNQGAYWVQILFAARMSTTMKNLAYLPANTANLLAFGVAVILNHSPGINRFRNTEAFKAWPDVAQQTGANAMQPSGIFAAALKETTPARAEHALHRTKRLLLHAQHAGPGSVIFH